MASLSLDTILTIASLVRTAVDLYDRIDDWPDQMKKLGRRMKNLDILLTELEDFVKIKSDNAFVSLFATQKKHLGLLLQNIREDTEKVNAIFNRWENDIGPLGFQFRFKTLTQAYFALGSSAEKIAALTDDVNEHLQGIRDYLQLMGFKATLLIGEQQNATAAPLHSLGEGKGPASGNGSGAKKPSSSPSSGTPRRDFKIIFIDPQNLGRSVAAEALAKLLKGWTIASKGDWRIRTIHSAGLTVKNRSDCTDTIESITGGLTEGGRKPDSLAINAVFDNKLYDYPFKKVVHENMLKKTSIGTKKDIFKTYDLILVFTSREYENLLKLRSALIEKEGKEATTARGKGRVLHLGSYLTLDGIPREIGDPNWKAGKRVKATRDDWNWKASQIKLALKAFLIQEMKWKQPPPNAPKAAGKKAGGPPAK